MHIHTDANERAPDLVVHSNPGMSGTDHPNLYWTVTSKGLFFCLSQVHYPRINPFFLLSFFRFSHASALSYMHALINTLRVFVLPDRFRVMKSMWPNPTGRERESDCQAQRFDRMWIRAEALREVTFYSHPFYFTSLTQTTSPHGHQLSTSHPPVAFKELWKWFVHIFSSLKGKAYLKMKTVILNLYDFHPSADNIGRWLSIYIYIWAIPPNGCHLLPKLFKKKKSFIFFKDWI